MKTLLWPVAILLFVFSSNLRAEEKGLTDKEIQRIQDALVAKGIRVSTLGTLNDETAVGNTKTQNLIVMLEGARPVRLMVTYEVNGVRVESPQLENNCLAKFLKTYALSIYLPEGSGTKEMRQMVDKTIFRATEKLAELKRTESAFGTKGLKGGEITQQLAREARQGLVERLQMLKGQLEVDSHYREVLNTNNLKKLAFDLELLKGEYEAREIIRQNSVRKLEKDPQATRETVDARRMLHIERLNRILTESAIEDLRRLTALDKILREARGPNPKVNILEHDLREVRHAITLIEKSLSRLKMLQSVMDSNTEPKDALRIRQSIIFMAGEFSGVGAIEGLAHKILGHGAELFLIDERILQLSDEKTPRLTEVEALLERIDYFQKQIERTNIEFKTEHTSKEQKAALGKEAMTFERELLLMDELIKESRRAFERANSLRNRIK